MFVVLFLVLFALGATCYTVPMIYQLSYEDGMPIGDIIIAWLGWIPLLCVEIGLNVYENFQDRE